MLYTYIVFYRSGLCGLFCVQIYCDFAFILIMCTVTSRAKQGRVYCVFKFNSCLKCVSYIFLANYWEPDIYMSLILILVKDMFVFLTPVTAVDHILLTFFPYMPL